MNSSNPIPDKFELHYRQQLSALMDGDLAPDEARFLLRRLRHDGELNAQWERWQLLADVLRGQATAPAPAGFAERVGAAIAAEPAIAGSAASASTERSRGALVRWGGALAASVAVVALFFARQQAPGEAEPAPLAAAPAAEPATAAPPAASPVAYVSLADAEPAAPAPVVASVAPRPAAAARRSATRTQQAARSAALARRETEPQRATGTTDAAPAAPVLIAGTAGENRTRDPFSSAGVEAQAHVPSRPWPRSVLQSYPGNGGFTASYPGGGNATHAFYPFEPRLLPDAPPVGLPAEAEPQD